MEYIIEAMAPTTRTRFRPAAGGKAADLPADSGHHIHGSPDGPWFFIIARNDPTNRYLQLIGITDTAMLRPQVFALQEGEVQIGLICSEKQAIDATLQSLSDEDARFGPVADKYWNARGGSATDGGSFIFNLVGGGAGPRSRNLTCIDKFGKPIEHPRQARSPIVPRRESSLCDGRRGQGQVRYL